MLLLKLPFSAFVQLTKNWITSPNIRLYQLQWDNYHHGIHKTLYFQNEIINQSCLWDWSKGKYLQDDTQSCLFSRGVKHLWPHFSQSFSDKNEEFLCSSERKFPEFSKTPPTFIHRSLLMPSTAVWTLINLFFGTPCTLNQMSTFKLDL